MFPDDGSAAAGGGVALMRDRGAGKIEGTAGGGGDHLDGVGVGEVLGRAGDLEGGDVDFGVGKGLEQGGEVLGTEERLVGLDVDVDLGRVLESDGVDAIGAAVKRGRSEDGGPAVGAAKGHDFVAVGGDEEVVKLRAGAGGFVHPGEHGTAGDDAQNLPRQSRAAEAGGNDAERARAARHAEARVKHRGAGRVEV